jgi:nicotinate-nucleotide adenylyltransferase
MAAFRCLDGLVPDGVAQIIAREGLYHYNAPWQQLPFEQLREVSLSLHKKGRVAHVIGCCETAVKLAERWGADPTDAARAGILHDITKALDGPCQLRLCDRYAIMVDDFERTHPKLLHSRTGSAVAHHVFGENDAVSDAIFWHTTGRADMTLLEKIIYLADYIEPCRTFDGVEPIRALAMQDLDRALLAGFEQSIAELTREKKPLGQYTVQARDYLRKELDP